MAGRGEGPTTDDAATPDPTADTVAEGDWPVPALYDVHPHGAMSPGIETEAHARPHRRFPPRVDTVPVLLVAVVLAIGGVALAAWWASSDDDRVAAAGPESEPTTATAPPSTGTTSTPTLHSTGTTAIPDVIGATYASARSRLESSELRPRSRFEHSDRPEGEVLGQSPAAGAKVEPGAIVVLTVSSGPDRVGVPDLEGLTARRAARVLRDAGLELELQAVRSEEVAGTVLTQTPAAGVSVEPGATVTLRVSSGPAVDTRDVPDVEGLTLASARSRLQALGLRSAVTKIASSQPAGTVVAQSPRAGATLRAGASVRLTVSSGPATVAVPDVTGLDESSARARLRALGFRVETVDEPTGDPGEDGLVIAQDPLGGTDAEDGTTVVLTIARLA
jgi:beta-lactam-binding protein with PASTA domain